MAEAESPTRQSVSVGFDYPDKCAHILFEEQAKQSPQSIALVEGDRKLTYEELDLQADRVASRLRTSGVGPEKLVGICATNSIEAIVGLMGIVKAGGAFVPLDPNYPIVRTKHIAEHAELSLIVAEPKLKSSLPQTEAAVISLNEELLQSGSTQTRSYYSEITLESASCVLYTSGSTGHPKGVVRTHRAIVNRLAWTRVQHGDVFCHNMSLSVGFSQERLFLPLMCGLTLAIVSETKVKDIVQFVAALESAGVTTVTLVPPLLRQLLSLGPSIGKRLPRLRSVAVGGAELPAAVAEAFGSILPQAELVNAYGSTESGSVIRGPVRHHAHAKSIPLGKPVCTARIYILNSNMQQVPYGDSGEVAVGAPCIARGYLHNPELTRQRFVSNPFPGEGGPRLFLTGDLARYLPSGEIEFLGRKDRQVKIRGYRVELDEVEAFLQKCDFVFEAVVISEASGEDVRIVAYVVKQPGVTSKVRDLRGYLETQLPNYMIPSVFIVLDHLPRTAAGKIDHSALPTASSIRPSLDAEHKAPRTGTERTIANIWSDVLDIRQVGLQDEFFDLGGDSLSLVKLLFRISERFGVELTAEQLRQHPTVESFSSLVDNALAHRTHNVLQAIPRIPRGHKPPLSFSQEFILMDQLHSDIRATRHDGALTGFGFCFNGPLNISALEDAIDCVIERHEILRTTFIPTASLGSMKLEGWNPIKKVFASGPIAPTIKFEARVCSAAVVDLETIVIEHLSAEEQQIEIQRLIGQIVQSLHDYASAPLMRAAVIRLGKFQHQLIMGLSHLVFDGWSRHVLQKNITGFYQAITEGKPDPLPTLPIQFSDYAYWQRLRLQGDVLKELVTFWDQRLSEFPWLAASDLPFSRNLKGAPSDAGRVIRKGISRELCSSLRTYISYLKTTLYTVLVTAVSILLHLYTRRERISLGGYFANRLHRDTEHLIGDFATFHLMGVEVSPERHIRELVCDVNVVVAEANGHQEIPFQLLQSIRFRRSAPYERLMVGGLPVTCELITDHGPESLPNVIVTRVGLLDRLTRFPMPLRLHTIESKTGEITIGAAYHTNQFDGSVMQEMLETLAEILRRIVHTPDARVSSLDSLVAGRVRRSGFHNA